MAGSNPRQGSEPSALHCSFCEKPQDEIRRLVASPSASICDECIDVCSDILKTAGDAADPPRMVARYRQSVPAEVPEDHIQCFLCGGVVPIGHAVRFARRGDLCVSCVVAVQANPLPRAD